MFIFRHFPLAAVNPQERSLLASLNCSALFIYSAQQSYQSFWASFFHWHCFWSSKPRDSSFIVLTKKAASNSKFVTVYSLQRMAEMLLIFTEAIYSDYIAPCPTNSLHSVYLSEHVY